MKILTKRQIYLFANLYFAIILSLFITSCATSDDQMLEQISFPEKEKIIEVTNDYLTFKDQKSYDSIHTYLFNHQAFLSSWESSFDKFKSMRTVFDQITTDEQEAISLNMSLAGYESYIHLVREEDGALDAVRVVSDPVTATMVNKNGLLWIGSKLVKFTYSFIIEVENPTDDQVVILRNAHDGKLPSFGKLTGIERKNISRTVTSRASDNCNNVYITNPQRRICGEVYSGSSNYQYIIGLTKHQRRVSLIWWSDNVEKVTLNVTGTVTWGYSSPISVNYSGEENNDNKIEVSVIECLNPCVLSSADLDGAHSCLCDNNEEPECFTNLVE
ncbi:MAG: hypothetical protein R3D00_08150 [Bacteroidia bacterium]